MRGRESNDGVGLFSVSALETADRVTLWEAL